jgi:hypothetical protein
LAWRDLLGVSMNNLIRDGLIKSGLYDKLLLNGGLIGFFKGAASGGIPAGNVWILEYSTIPQPAGTNGIWTDSGIWKSDSIWYS